jgi:PilZ domain
VTEVVNGLHTVSGGVVKGWRVGAGFEMTVVPESLPLSSRRQPLRISRAGRSVNVAALHFMPENRKRLVRAFMALTGYRDIKSCTKILTFISVLNEAVFHRRKITGQNENFDRCEQDMCRIVYMETPKRKYTRCKLEKRVGFFINGAFFFGKGVSVSEGGMMFRTSVPVQAGDAIETEFYVGEKMIRPKGVTIYVLKAMRPYFLVGVAFPTLSETDRKEIQKYIGPA